MRPSERPRQHLVAVAVASSIGLASALASAQGADAQRAATAQGLFDRAIEEMKKGDLDSACPRLEEVTQLVPDALGAKVELARCYERWGRVASAWTQWTRVEALARRKGQADRQAEAAARSEALRSRVARLTVEVAPEAAAIPGLIVRRGPVDVGKAQWGAAVPIDTGKHEIVVTAPGYVSFRRSVVVGADGESRVVKVPALEKEPTEPATGKPAAAGRPRREPAEDGAAAAWRRPVGIAAVAIGGAGLVLGGVLGALAIAKNDESNGPGLCNADTDRCSFEGRELRRDALGLATASTIAVVAGGVVAAGGLVLWMTAPAGGREASASVGVSPRGVWLMRRF